MYWKKIVQPRNDVLISCQAVPKKEHGSAREIWKPKIAEEKMPSIQNKEKTY